MKKNDQNEPTVSLPWRPGPNGPHHVVFVASSPLGPMAAICFAALAHDGRARATFATRPSAAAGRGGRTRARASASGQTRRSHPGSAAIDAMMAEVGLHAWKPLERRLDATLIEEADLVVTIGRPGRPRDPKLPAVPRRHEHWSFAPRSPETPPRARARQLRDAVRAQVAMLIFMEGWGRPEMTRAAERLARPTAVEGHHPFIPVRPFRIQSFVALPH